MANRLLGVAIVACFLAEASVVQAQAPANWSCGEPISDPARCGCPAPAPAPSGPGMCIADFHPPSSGCDCDEDSYRRGWYSVEWLSWILPNPHLPAPLATSSTGPPFGTGVLGARTTTVLLQGKTGYNEPFNGGRATAGIWFNRDNTIGFEVSGFGLENQRAREVFTSGPAGTPPLSVPFVNAQTGAESVLRLGVPGSTFGRLEATNSSRLWSGEANLVAQKCCCFGNIQMLAGFRYLHFEDTFDLRGDTTPLPLPNTTVEIDDHFSTRNSFYGGQVGLRACFGGECLNLVITTKVGIGDNHQTLTTRGTTTTFPVGGGSITNPGGLFAVASNIGTFKHDIFGVVPEGTARVNYHLNKYWTASIGYNYIWWNRVAAAAEQIDRTVDIRQVPALGGGTFQGATRPLVPARERDFWAQGASLGLQLDY